MLKTTDNVDYTIHGKTLFIRSNGIQHFIVHGPEVSKIIERVNGDELIEPFHTLGKLPLNSEAKLLNELRIRGEI